MARKAKRRRRARKAAKRGWWSSLDAARRRRLVRGAGVFFLTVTVALLAAVGMRQLEIHVKGMAGDRAMPAITWVDLPESLEEVAKDDLLAAIRAVADHDWIDDSLCREMAVRLATVGWVAQVHYVRRASGAEFKISCRYRLPVAMVQQDDAFFLVDAESVRLPGTYRYDPKWRLIQGVRVQPPQPGAAWDSGALRAGLALLAELHKEPFSDQITAVLVGNFGGRVDPRASHIELATDRAGGRIRWGSAPGFELEENAATQKLAILRENFRRTGRVDEAHPVIDVSTYPDRYTVPG